MKQLDTNDMIGYKAPSEKIKSHNVDRLIGVKNLKFYNLPPIETRTKEDVLEDFKLKYDNRKNDTPYDLHEESRDTDKEILTKRDRMERVYSMMNAFVPGLDSAGSTRAKVGSWLGIKKSKRALARQKRSHIINKVGEAATEFASNQRPDLDPNLVHMVGRTATGLVSSGTNSAFEANRKRKLRNAKAAKKEAKSVARSKSNY